MNLVNQNIKHIIPLHDYSFTNFIYNIKKKIILELLFNHHSDLRMNHTTCKKNILWSKDNKTY